MQSSQSFLIIHFRGEKIHAVLRFPTSDILIIYMHFVSDSFWLTTTHTIHTFFSLFFWGGGTHSGNLQLNILYGIIKLFGHRGLQKSSHSDYYDIPSKLCHLISKPIFSIRLSLEARLSNILEVTLRTFNNGFINAVFLLQQSSNFIHLTVEWFCIFSKLPGN